MEKAEKVRKTVTRISAGVILVALVVFNFQIGLQSNDTSHLSLSDLTFGFFTPAAEASSIVSEKQYCGLCVTNEGNYLYQDNSSSFLDHCPAQCDIDKN